MRLTKNWAIDFYEHPQQWAWHRRCEWRVVEYDPEFDVMAFPMKNEGEKIDYDRGVILGPVRAHTWAFGPFWVTHYLPAK